VGAVHLRPDWKAQRRADAVRYYCSNDESDECTYRTAYRHHIDLGTHILDSNNSTNNLHSDLDYSKGQSDE
jgi:hypothetical protein